MTYNKEGRLESRPSVNYQAKEQQTAKLLKKRKALQVLFYGGWLTILVIGSLLPSAETASLSQMFVVFCLPNLLGVISAFRALPDRLPRPLPFSLFLCQCTAGFWWGEGLGVLIKAHVMPLCEQVAWLNPLAHLAPLSEVMGAVFICSLLFCSLAFWMNQALAKVEVAMVELWRGTGYPIPYTNWQKPQQNCD